MCVVNNIISQILSALHPAVEVLAAQVHMPIQDKSLLSTMSPTGGCSLVLKDPAVPLVLPGNTQTQQYTEIPLWSAQAETLGASHSVLKVKLYANGQREGC